MIYAEVKGADEVIKKLGEIKNNTAKRYVRKAVKAALNPFLVASKSNAVSMIGGAMGSMIATSLRIRPFKRQRKYQYGMNVQISKDYSSYFVYTTKRGLRHYIPAAIEHGHAKRGRTQKTIDAFAKAKRKWFNKKAALNAIAIEYGNDKVPAIPFIRKAYDMKVNESESLFGEIIAKELKL